MKTNDFDYFLPEDLIAQEPIKDRVSSNLLVYKNHKIFDKKFYDIIDYLDDNDVLVLNDTKVLPSRLYGIKENTNANIEILLLNQEEDFWNCLVKPAKRIKIGDSINFNNILKAVCVGVKEEGIRLFKFIYDGIFYEILDSLGEMPLPPYIRKKLENNNDYQTVYARNLGSAAAPTAGLHFNNDLLNKIKSKNIKLIYVTLNVGLGTFRPVMVDDINDHKMHFESYYVSEESCDLLNNAVMNNKRIIACGTTSVRVLEDNFCNGFKSGYFNTNIFIYPGYEFKVVDGIITNFHLPKSTLIMLISAFIGREETLDIYKYAVEKKYRFFSFGDAMFLMEGKHGKRRKMSRS